MNRFIWVGRDCVNLDCVIRFTLEDDGKRIVVRLRDAPPDERTLSIDGEDAERLLAVLQTVDAGAVADKGFGMIVPLMPHNTSLDEADFVDIEPNAD